MGGSNTRFFRPLASLLTSVIAVAPTIIASVFFAANTIALTVLGVTTAALTAVSDALEFVGDQSDALSDRLNEAFSE